jgi:hypothetical protein
MALSACAKEIQFATPPLNEQDQQHLDCAAVPDIQVQLARVPQHIFLSGSLGAPIVDQDGFMWVRFDRVQEREGEYVDIVLDGGDVSTECRADLHWLAKVWTDLQAE